jgi:hypothetical protein
MKVEMSLGDVVDRITILRIKVERISDAARRENVRHELAVLEAAWSDAGLPVLEGLADWAALSGVNLRLKMPARSTISTTSGRRSSGG